jgi:hypothetical protein
MITIVKENLLEWADKIKEEIDNDTSSYFHPVSKKHKIFEQAYMKFVNRNLNYFDYRNMIANALREEPEFHLGLKKTLEFCNYVKKITGKEDAPFGRMCVWSVPPNHTILPHTDNFTYHTLIDRYIFFVSKHPTDSIIVNINEVRVKSDTGVLFEFSPAFDKHEFVNKSSDRLYFLGFDIWKKDRLAKFSKNMDLDKILENPNRYNFFGGSGTNCKYMSEH